MSRTATTRAAMLEAMLEITAPLDGEILQADDVDGTDGPIKLLCIPAGHKDTARVLAAAVPRVVHRGMIFGEIDTHPVAERVLPEKVRTNLKRWVWSQPWAFEDLERLRVAHPSLVMHDDTRRGIATELWEAYADYTGSVSPYDMAMSFETAIFLLHLCRTTQPSSVADFGSGFSSYVLRHYARQAGINDVTSVDDDGAWLVRSIDFMVRHKVGNIGTFKHWDLCRTALPSTDIVFHDLGGGEVRNVAMAPVMASATRFAVVDDCQFDQHRNRFYELSAELGFEPYALVQTNDHIQRFSSLAVRS